MRTMLALATLLFSLQARGDCTPAPPDTIVAAERAALDAEQKADQAESLSVRSGNPGAARRAELARQEASKARQRASQLACKAAPPGSTPPATKPLPGY